MGIVMELSMDILLVLEVIYLNL